MFIKKQNIFDILRKYVILKWDTEQKWYEMKWDTPKEHKTERRIKQTGQSDGQQHCSLSQNERT